MAAILRELEVLVRKILVFRITFHENLPLFSMACLPSCWGNYLSRVKRGHFIELATNAAPWGAVVIGFFDEEENCSDFQCSLLFDCLVRFSSPVGGCVGFLSPCGNRSPESAESSCWPIKSLGPCRKHPWTAVYLFYSRKFGRVFPSSCIYIYATLFKRLANISERINVESNGERERWGDYHYWNQRDGATWEGHGGHEGLCLSLEKNKRKKKKKKKEKNGHQLSYCWDLSALLIILIGPPIALKYSILSGMIVLIGLEHSFDGWLKKGLVTVCWADVPFFMNCFCLYPKKKKKKNQFSYMVHWCLLGAGFDQFSNLHTLLPSHVLVQRLNFKLINYSLLDWIL